MPVRYLKPVGIAPPAGHYSHAVVGAGLVFVSGQLAISPAGEPCPHLSFEEQVRLSMANVSAALQAAGSDFAHLLKVTAYIVCVDNWPRFNGVYKELMGAAKPARAIVPVPELHYGCAVEIDAIAMRRAE